MSVFTNFLEWVICHLPPGWGLVAQSGGSMIPFSKNGKGSHILASQPPTGLQSPFQRHFVFKGPLLGLCRKPLRHFNRHFVPEGNFPNLCFFLALHLKNLSKYICFYNCNMILDWFWSHFHKNFREINFTKLFLPMFRSCMRITWHAFLHQFAISIIWPQLIAFWTLANITSIWINAIMRASSIFHVAFIDISAKSWFIRCNIIACVISRNF